MALATTQNVVSVKTCTNHPVFKLRCLFRASLSTFRLICASSWWVERRRSSSSPQTTLPLTLRSMCMTTGPWVSAGCLVLCPQRAWHVLRKYWGHNLILDRATPLYFAFLPTKQWRSKGYRGRVCLSPRECSLHLHLHVNQLHSKTQKERDSSLWQKMGPVGSSGCGLLKKKLETNLKRSWPAVHVACLLWTRSRKSKISAFCFQLHHSERFGGVSVVAPLCLVMLCLQ